MDNKMEVQSENLLPDSGFGFWWVKVPVKKGTKIIGAGMMDGIVCKEEELHEWVSQQFAAECNQRGGKYYNFRSSNPLINGSSSNQVEFLKKAVEEGIEVLGNLTSTNKDLNKDIENWKKELLDKTK